MPTYPQNVDVGLSNLTEGFWTSGSLVIPTGETVDLGLYGSSGNEPPEPHRSVLIAKAKEVTPRLADGAPDPLGKIGHLFLGNSNRRRIADRAVAKLMAFPGKREGYHAVNGSQWGQTIDELADPNSWYWLDDGGNSGNKKTIPELVAAAGLTFQQIQAVNIGEPSLNWINNNEAGWPTTVSEIRNVVANLIAQTCVLLFQKMPYIKQVTLSLPTYGGYAGVFGVDGPDPVNDPFNGVCKAPCWLRDVYEALACQDVVVANMLGNPGFSVDEIGAICIGTAPLSNGDDPNSVIMPYEDGPMATYFSDLDTDKLHPAEPIIEKVGQMERDIMLCYPWNRPIYIE